MFPFQETWTFVDFFLECIFKPQKKCGHQHSWSQLILVGSLRGVLDTHKWWWNQRHRLEAYWDVWVKNVQGKMCEKTTKKKHGQKTTQPISPHGIKRSLDDLYWSQQQKRRPRFWLQIHLFVQMGSLLVSHLLLTHFCFHWTEAMLWSWLMQVFWWKRMGLNKTASRGNVIFHQISRGILWLGISTNLDHQSCWNCWVIFQKFVLSFLRNDNLSFWSLYLLEVKPFSALHPHEVIVAYGRGNATWKVNPMKPLFMCDTSSFRTTPFDQEFWIWRSLFQ